MGRIEVPGTVMLAAVAACLVAHALALWLALGQPWLGVELTPDFETGEIHLDSVRADGPAAALSAPALLIAIETAEAGAQVGRRIELQADDHVEEPDFFDSYERLADFMARQTMITQLLRSGGVTLETIDPATAQVARTTVQPQARPLSSLPFAYWLQVFVGTASLLLGAWVWALRPGEWGPRFLALTGLAILGFTFPAAVYSTRELALDGTTFRVLSALNHIGALTFGAAMISLFLTYPTQIVRPRLLWPLWGGVALWLVADIARFAPSPGIGHQLPTLIEMLTIVACAILQWWVSRGDPLARAALRWLGLSVAIGAGAFVAIITGPVLFGGLPPLPQGFAFVFFLLIHAGVALGVARYRLFELDRWAFLILFYILGGVLLLALDTALVLLVRVEPAPSLGIALLVLVIGYLPLRDAIWRRLMARREVAEDEMFAVVSDAAYAGSDAERSGRWHELLRRLFDPLEIIPANEPVEQTAIAAEGLELLFCRRLPVRRPCGLDACGAAAHCLGRGNYPRRNNSSR